MDYQCQAVAFYQVAKMKANGIAKSVKPENNNSRTCPVFNEISEQCNTD